MTVEVHGINEAHFRLFQSHDQRVGTRPVAEEIHPMQQSAAGDAGTCEDDFLAGGQVHRLIDTLGIFDAHRRGTFQVLWFRNYQPGQNLAVQAAQCGRGEHAFWGASRTHHRVHGSAAHGSGNARGKIAVRNQANARADRANVRDELLVPRAVEDHGHQILHVAVVAARDGAQVIFHRRVQINRALRRRPHDNFLHVEIGSMQQAAMFAGREHHDGARLARRAKIGALSGSTAMSTLGYSRLLSRTAAPTFSPMKSMGASSRSPSPMTMVPSMPTRSISARMASTAAWSEPERSPWPMVRAEAMAAFSTVRRNSRLSSFSMAAPEM